MRSVLLLLFVSVGLLSGLNACLVPDSGDQSTQVDSATAAPSDLQRQVDSMRALTEDTTGLLKLETAGGEAVSDSVIRAVIAQRKRTGNTGVFSTQQLAQYFSGDWLGYRFTQPGGEVIRLADEGVNMSLYNYVMKKGSRTIRVNVTDLNGYESNLISAFNVHNDVLEYESGEERVKAVSISEQVVGFSTYYQKRERAEISLLVGNRFTVSMEATNVNSAAPLQEYARFLKLDRLAKAGQ